MVNVLFWVLLLYGIYSCLVFGFMMNSKNSKSAIVFQVIPFIGGVASILVSLHMLQFIDLFKIFLK